MPHRVKIQVVKALTAQDALGNMISSVNVDPKYICTRLKEGQEFIVEEDGSIKWYD